MVGLLHLARVPLRTSAFSPSLVPLRRYSRTGLSSRSRGGRGRAGREERISGGLRTYDTTDLGWETFEFSGRPKLDGRFDKLAAGGIGPEDRLCPDREAEEDEHASSALEESARVLVGMSAAETARCQALISPLLTEARLARIDAVLRMRTARSRFLFENPSNPSNVWACLRTIDSFGIMNVDLVVDPSSYVGPSAVAQKRGMRVAMGSAQWLTLRSHAGAMDAVADMRAKGFKIYASDLSPGSVDVRALDWDDGPICVVMGNEETGISDEMRRTADATFTLPMSGFAESFNLSAATAVTLAHMSAASNESAGTGPLRPGDIDADKAAVIRLQWMLSSLPKKGMGGKVLKRHGIELPEAFNRL